MSKHDTDTSDQHAAKRRWLNAHEEGYHKAMGNRQVQMIAIGGAIGTGLFLGAGARLQMAGPALALVYLICGLFSFFILRALGELVLHRPSSGSFVSYAREFLGEKAAYVAGWMYFINWAMTGIVDITAVALYMHYWGCVWRRAAVGFCARCTYHRWHHEYDRCEMVCGDGVLVCAY